ncbi:hypothetical protein EDB80DRAFT_807276 [Ilyonectria destructans]|nr:hypothetical protein EDB80DRAFT_807276 [Ilyonectria destructans]
MIRRLLVVLLGCQLSTPQLIGLRYRRPGRATCYLPATHRPPIHTATGYRPLGPPITASASAPAPAERATFRAPPSISVDGVPCKFRGRRRLREASHHLSSIGVPPRLGARRGVVSRRHWMVRPCDGGDASVRQREQ